MHLYVCVHEHLQLHARVLVEGRRQPQDHPSGASYLNCEAGSLIGLKLVR